MEPEQVGDYRVAALLGEGGQGVVYLGESPSGARVAIKVLHATYAADPEIRRRFLREAEVAASVAAFCTARVVGTGALGERPYIVSEYIPGPSLDTLVKTDGPRSGSGLDRLAVATLTALASIHRAGVVHRDFKPANVILGPEGPVVIDFGIARALSHMTSNTHLAGTPAYMAPEQFTDDPVTAVADMFSWASTMIFAATGRTPFAASSIPAAIHAILHREPDVSGLPDPLRPLVAACLVRDPAARPTASDLLRGLTGHDPGRPLPSAPSAGAPLSGTPLSGTPLSGGPLSGGPAAGRTLAEPVPYAASAAPAGTDEFAASAGTRMYADPVKEAGWRPPFGNGPLTPADSRGEPDLRPTEPSTWRIRQRESHRRVRRASRRRVRRLIIAAAAVTLALTVVATAAVVYARPWLRDRHGGETATSDTAAKPDPVLDLGAFSRADVDDRFTSGDADQYAPYQPHGNERVPVIANGEGRFTGSGTSPYFAMLAGSGMSSTGNAVSVLTVGGFARTGRPEDSVFVGWVKDGHNYVSAWYNNTRKETGLEVRVNGQYVSVPGMWPLSLQSGDRFALVVSGDTITSYARTGGTWKRLLTGTIGDALATPEARRRYRYGFGLRGSSGEISITRLEGRSAQ
jgi:predicted Ser/Thr protein kinase